MKLRKVYLIAFVVLAFAVLLFAIMTTQRHSSEFGESANLNTPGQRYTLEVVTSARDKSKGLSDRSSLPQDRGMLFVYDREAVRCFWMKDMNFSIDIIWLNKNRDVVHIEQNLSPDTYPRSFCPEQDAMYVIELNANETYTAGISLGDKLDF